MHVGMHSDLIAVEDKAGVAVLLHTHEAFGAARGQRTGIYQALGCVRQVFRFGILQEPARKMRSFGSSWEA